MHLEKDTGCGARQRFDKGGPLSLLHRNTQTCLVVFQFFIFIWINSVFKCVCFVVFIVYVKCERKGGKS